MAKRAYVPCLNCGEKYNSKEGDKYCGNCRQITEIWQILKNGRIKRLSDDERNKFDEMRLDEKLVGTYFLNWPFIENSEPELHQFDGDSFEYISVRPHEFRAVLRILGQIKKGGGAR